VTEWASRAGLFSRMTARAHPSGNVPPDVSGSLAKLWDYAAKANALEGEVASHTRKLEALERRGRALRAEIGRKVEELAQEESRALRDAAAYGEEADAARRDIARAQQQAVEKVAAADDAEKRGRGSRKLFEEAGAARALVEAKREWLQTREARRLGREATARDLRRQIEELRGQLARYAEALEEDLASGREKVAVRTREGISYERSFQEASNRLLRHLKGKPECRNLLNEILTSDREAASQTDSRSIRTAN
jgi:serine/threonine-protein kinase